MKTAALGIRNLTDARYFAAMNVDWIGFDMSVDSPLSMEHILAFSEWVEGPRLLLDVRGRTTDEIASFLAEFEADALFVDNNVYLDMYNGKVAKMSHDSADIVISTVPGSDSADADLWWIVNSPHQLHALEKLPNCTIAVTGGDEHKVGVKNYDELDEIFEKLEAMSRN